MITDDKQRAKAKEAREALCKAADALREVHGVTAGGILVMIEGLIARCTRMLEEGTS